MEEFLMTNLFWQKMSIKSLAIPDFPRLVAECSLGSAVNFFGRFRVLTVAVVDVDNRLVGVISSHDLLEEVYGRLADIRLAPAYADTSDESFDYCSVSQMPIRCFVREPQLVIGEDEAARLTFPMLLQQGFQEVFVVDQENRLVGALVLNDMANSVWEEITGLSEIFGKVMDAVYNGVLVVNAEGKIIFFNPSAERFFNLPAREAMGQHIHKLIPDSPLPMVAASGQPMLAQRQQIGSRTVIVNRTPVVLHGQNVGAVSVFQDVTELDSISEELNNTKKLKATLEAVVENPYEGMVAVDENARIIMMNQFYRDVLGGLDLEDVLGKHIWEFTPHSQLPETIKTGVTQFGELWKVANHEFMIMRVPIRKDGKIIGAIGKTLFKDMGLARVFAKKLIQLENDLEYYKEELRKVHNSEYTFDQIIGESDKIQTAKNLAQRAARTSSTVLIMGESGTGKEIFAHAIHNAGLRRQGPFVKVNCAAVPETLLESELFGYAEGAFTGARKGGKPGKFELANRGTIFLDEIGDMSLNMQAKLLRVIQEREVERVGGTQIIKIDVRVIAATNRDLRQMVEENKFRRDLFYRLNVVVLELPPLRERIEDLDLLLSYLIARLNSNLSTQVMLVSDDAKDVLRQYAWPGNIRELENILERTMNISDDRVIQPEHLPVQLRRAVGETKGGAGQKTLEEALQTAEKEIILNALRQAGGNKMQAARVLNIHRSVLYKKLAKYRLAADTRYPAGPALRKYADWEL